jgi:DNA-binding transcriptional LysR family regulator
LPIHALSATDPEDRRAVRDLPIDVLRTLTAVAELGSLTAAGERLGRSQPALSQQLSKLEDGLGLTLIERRGRQLRFTSAGEKLLRHARTVIALNDAVLAELRESPLSGTLSLGIPSEFATTLLPGMIRQYSLRYPQVSLQVVTDLSRNLLREQREQGYDLVLALHDRPERAGSELLRVDEVVWVSSGDFDSSADPLPLVVAPDGCIYRSRMTRELDRAGRPWRVVYTNRDLSGIQSAIEEGMGITALARSSVPRGLQVLKRSVDLPVLGELGISLVWARREPSEAALRLGEFLTQRLGAAPDKAAAPLTS